VTVTHEEPVGRAERVVQGAEIRTAMKPILVDVEMEEIILGGQSRTE
jgi:hypothetical protein